MNSAGAPKRRSARLSAEGAEENEPPAKKTKVNGVETTTVSTKEQDGDSGAPSKRKRKEGEVPRLCLRFYLHSPHREFGGSCGRISMRARNVLARKCRTGS